MTVPNNEGLLNLNTSNVSIKLLNVRGKKHLLCNLNTSNVSIKQISVSIDFAFVFHLNTSNVSIKLLEEGEKEGVRGFKYIQCFY